MSIYLRYLLRAPFVYRNWFAMMVSHTWELPGILYLRNGLSFEVRPGTTDRSTINEDFILKPYFPDARFQIGPSDRVLDVGANIGAFAINAASQAKNGVVYAVEPVSGNIKALQNNLALNRITNVKVVPAAVGSGTAKAVVAVCGSSSTTISDPDCATAHEVVDQISLTSLVDEMEGVDFLKMDCQGAEFDIFFSTVPEVLRKIRRISMEFHNLSAEKNVHTLKGFLEKAGFDVTVVGEHWNGLLFAIQGGAEQSPVQQRS